MTHRWSHRSFAYYIDDLRPNTVYNLTLGFIGTYDLYCNPSGDKRRVMDIQVNGLGLAYGLDVFGLVGCEAAYFLSQSVSVDAKGSLAIDLIQVENNPMITVIDLSPLTIDSYP